MKTKKKAIRSPLAVAILGMLAHEPLHPYRMQQLIRERAKDEVINVRQRASIYQTIDRLVRDGLVAVRETEKEGGRPDRTIYGITPEGQGVLQEWMRDMIAAPKQEFPEFPVALAFLALLTAEDALLQFRRRTVVLEKELARLNEAQEQIEGIVPRLFLIEMEYMKALLLAELGWLRSVVSDLESGRLTWSKEWLDDVTRRLTDWQDNNKSNL